MEHMPHGAYGRRERNIVSAHGNDQYIVRTNVIANKFIMRQQLVVPVAEEAGFDCGVEYGRLLTKDMVKPECDVRLRSRWLEECLIDLRYVCWERLAARPCARHPCFVI